MNAKRRHAFCRYIIGFIQRGRAEDLLASFKEDGAFLLRFSDSMLGAISLSYTFKKPNSEIQVLSVNPFNDAELKKLSLADRLSGSNYQFVFYHAVCNGRQQICKKSKLEAFPPKPRNVRRGNIFTLKLILRLTLTKLGMQLTEN